MRPSRLLLPVALTAMLTAGVAAPGALAAPDVDGHPDADGDVDTEVTSDVDDQRALAREVQARIDANGARISALAEELNGAEYRLGRIDTEIATIREQIVDAETEVDRRRSHVNRRAAASYKRAGTAGPLDLLDISDPSERNTHAKYTGAVAAADGEVVAELQVAQRELVQHERAQEALRVEAQAERDELARRTTEIQEANAQQAFLLGSVNDEIQALMDEERAREHAELAALAPGAPPPSSGPSSSEGPPSPGIGGGNPIAGPPAVTPTRPDPPPATPPPPPTHRAQVAIDFARAQLGKWYCFGGNGWGRGAPFHCPPNTFDCSGLTMRAWGAAGVSMPHYSGAQYAMFPKVPLHALRPGDLVFYGPGGSQHVGLYVGGGQMIEAPYTGARVRIAPIHRPGGGPVGAVRPG